MSQSVRFGGSSFRLSRTASRNRVMNCMCRAAPGGGTPTGRLDAFVVPFSLLACSMKYELSARPSTPRAAKASAAGANSFSTGHVAGHDWRGPLAPSSRTNVATSAVVQEESDGLAGSVAASLPPGHLPSAAEERARQRQRLRRCGKPGACAAGHRKVERARAGRGAYTFRRGTSCRSGSTRRSHVGSR